MEKEEQTSPVPDEAGNESPMETELVRGRQLARGTVKLLSAQALSLVAGLVISIYLTRQLGPELYGVYAVAFAIVIWVQTTAVLMFSSTTIKFIAEAPDWQMVAATLVKAQLFISLGATLLLIIAAPALASWLRTPELTGYLRLFALGIPFFALARVHRSTLLGGGLFGRGAIVSVSHYLARLALVILFVELGLSITGAILASVGASLIHLIVARLLVHPPLLRRSTFPVRRLVRYVLPLFLHAMGMRLFIRVDLLVVKALSETAAEAGYYGAARNLTIVPVGMFGASFVPLLLATLTRLIRQRRDVDVRTIIWQSLLLSLCLVPFAGLAAGEAPEIVKLVYGSPFSSSVPLLAWLIFASLAIMLISVCTAAFTAAGRPNWSFALSGPLVPLVLGAHLILVPHFGATGAAAATTILAGLGACVAMLLIYRQYGVYIAPVILIKIAAITLLAYMLSSLWRASGMWVIPELLAVAGAILGCLLLLRVLTRQDLAYVRSLFFPTRRTSP